MWEHVQNQTKRTEGIAVRGGHAIPRLQEHAAYVNVRDVESEQSELLHARALPPQRLEDAKRAFVAARPGQEEAGGGIEWRVGGRMHVHEPRRLARHLVHDDDETEEAREAAEEQLHV